IKSSYLIATGLALALAGWLLSGQLGAGKTPPESNDAGSGPQPAAELPKVRVRELVAEPVERMIVVNGRTAPARAVTVRAETDGRVVELGPERGELIRPGDVLVRIDARERKAMVEQAEATLRMREIEYEAARRLGAKGFQAETKVAEAKANLEAAQATLERARIQLDHTEIRAPFDGVLETRPVELGDFVDVGDEVAMVIDQDPFLVIGDVAQVDAGALGPGMAGRAVLVTGQRVEGRLRYVASMADPETRTFRVELEVPNPHGRFPANVSAELQLPLGAVPAHKVSSSLLVLDDAGAIGVRSVDQANVVRFHPATVVRSGAEAVWLAGLPERLRLITVGQGFVRSGETVTPVPEEPQAAESTGERRS
ncbi:MAG: efflux RND transporter periplasmic adaptor subunit, partial [Geminicoccales bacterium]